MESTALRSFIDATPKRKQSVGAGTKSCMASHWAAIVRFKASGYSLSRIQEFLKQQDAEVSRGGIQKFITLHLVAK